MLPSADDGLTGPNGARCMDEGVTREQLQHGEPCRCRRPAHLRNASVSDDNTTAAGPSSAGGWGLPTATCPATPYLLRKLMLTGAIGLVSPGTVLQSFCSVTISLFFLALHVWMW